ncbi:cation transporter [Methanoculleus horonobensis]|uniref:cation transporter n=1 Tax=Methanoculleus horonobensis TaxID=528314 RepID=UPI00373FC95D
MALSVYSGSLALRADGIHSFVDVVASVALIAGVYLSSRRRRISRTGSTRLRTSSR